ncbi:MAG: DUF2723 domain-containing protein [Anaerolineae bacterium]|nr:DUF2723 domain-containing protein [Gemmatimonadaceae bacterium]
MTSPRITSPDFRPSYLAATIATGAVLLLYLITLSPTTAMWDTSEYMSAAYTFGLPHPPGNPLFILIGRFFSIIPIAPSVAQRINVLAALSSAVAAGVWFLVAERVLASWITRRWPRIVGGALAALVGATSFTVWNQSVVNEKVYTVSLGIFAAIAWLTLRWLDAPDAPKADRNLILVAYLLGLGYANHMAGILPGPAVAIAVLMRRPATILRYRLILTAIAAAILGLTPFVTQPIRSAHFPEINMGQTTGCETRLEASCTFTSETLTRWKEHFNRDQYPKNNLLVRQAPFSAQIGMYWMYFKWQWLRDTHSEHQAWQAILAVVFLVLGLIGGYVHWKRHRVSFWFYGPFLFTITLLFIYLLNFKYGWTQAQHLGITDGALSEVRDRDYFFIWSFSAWSVWVALGLVYIWESLAAMAGNESVAAGKQFVVAPKRRSWLLAAPVLLIALIPLGTNWRSASRAGDTTTRDWAKDLLNSVEPYGVLITGGDNDTYPLWYAQEVEGIRKDVVVAVTSLLNTDWYARQMIRRPIYDYDAAKGPEIYRGKNWPKPSGPPMSMSLQDVAKMPPYIEMPQAQIFREGNIAATIPAGFLSRDQIIVLNIIKDTFPERPMFFSRTAGNYGERLGLESYLLTQGFARKLLPDTVTGVNNNAVLIRGEGWLDVERTFALWKTWEGIGSLKRMHDWTDRASANIPYTYVATGALLAEALNQTGRPKEAEQVYGTALEIAQATRLDELLARR